MNFRKRSSSRGDTRSIVLTVVEFRTFLNACLVAGKLGEGNIEFVGN